MRLVIEKYRTKPGSENPSEPFSVEFKRYNRECLVTAIMELLEHNFTMIHPPKYRDSEGDMILLDTKEAFQAAVDDILRTQEKTIVVHVDGVYNDRPAYSESKPADSANSSAGRCSCTGCRGTESEGSNLQKWVQEIVQKEVEKSMSQHPLFSAVRKMMVEMLGQKAGDSFGNTEQKSTQTLETYCWDVAVETNSSLATAVGSSLTAAPVENESSSKDEQLTDVQAVGSLLDFELTEVSPVWDINAIYAKSHGKGKPFNRSSEILKTIRHGDAVFSKHWVIHRIGQREWTNVALVIEQKSDALELHSSKLVMKNVSDSCQDLDFAVWVKCPLSTEYAYVAWRLIEISENNELKILDGPKIFLEICQNPFGDESSGINASSVVERPLSAEGSDNFSNYEFVVDETGSVRDVRGSCESVAASDYEVIDG